MPCVKLFKNSQEAQLERVHEIFHVDAGAEVEVDESLNLEKQLAAAIESTERLSNSLLKHLRKFFGIHGIAEMLLNLIPDSQEMNTIEKKDSLDTILSIG